MVTVALLATMLPTLAGAARLLPASGMTSHPAGCHGMPAPARQHGNFECCVARHHSAVVTDFFSSRPPQWIVLASLAETQAHAMVKDESSIAIVSSYSPPGISPLRI
jgi:hypothetical protein